MFKDFWKTEVDMLDKYAEKYLEIAILVCIFIVNNWFSIIFLTVFGEGSVLNDIRLYNLVVLS